MTSIRTGSAWKELVPGTSVRTGGAWKEVVEIFVRVGGAWKSAWVAFVVTVSGQTVDASTAAPGTATAGVRFNSDGTVDQRVQAAYSQIDSGTDWIIPNAAGAASGTYIRATEVSASGSPLTKNGTMNTWTLLTSDQEWSAVRSGASVGTSTWTITIEIAADSGGVDILDSADYVLNADLA